MDLLITEEDQLFGINHALIGGCALERWNFSELMILAVNNHHLPSYTDLEHVSLDTEVLRYVLALFLSDQMARLFTNWTGGITRIYPLHESYFALVDRKKLVNKVIDINFINQMLAASACSFRQFKLLSKPETPSLSGCYSAEIPEGKHRIRLGLRQASHVEP